MQRSEDVNLFDPIQLQLPSTTCRVTHRILFRRINNFLLYISVNFRFLCGHEAGTHVDTLLQMLVSTRFRTSVKLCTSAPKESAATSPRPSANPPEAM